MEEAVAKRKKKEREKMLNNYYGGMMSENSDGLGPYKKEQMEFTNQMIKKAVFEELFE